MARMTVLWQEFSNEADQLLQCSQVAVPPSSSASTSSHAPTPEPREPSIAEPATSSSSLFPVERAAELGRAMIEDAEVGAVVRPLLWCRCVVPVRCAMVVCGGH